MTALEPKKIKAPAELLDKPSFMAYPVWLTLTDEKINRLYENHEALTQAYIMFFLSENARCQRQLSGQIVNRLANVMSNVCNEYDCTMEGLKYTKHQVESLNAQWLSRIDPLVRNMAVSDFGFHVYIQEGSHAQIQAGIDLKDMMSGDVTEDFLFRHANTPHSFAAYSFALWSKAVMQPEVE